MVFVKLKFRSPLTCGAWSLINLSMKKPRALTHDERKAAEAAFTGRPFHDSWSKSARVVYDGILNACGFSSKGHDFPGENPIKSPPAVVPLPEKVPTYSTSIPVAQTETETAEALSHQIALRREAIEAGLLIDVTRMAKRIGFNIAVGITKSLWDRNIKESADVSTEDRSTRIRDMLLAVRLRLASLDSPTPWVEVPVLFPSSGKQDPQIFPIYALFHKDPIASDCLTLIHPKELSSIRSSPASTTEDELA